MELFAEAVSVVGALLLSVSCGLLAEELLFGGLVRLFFARQAGARVPIERKKETEEQCLR
ncbi:MAG TPA: hypothetical protein VHU89_12685 [Acidobacteriaceae bacterium]|jgi:hypothetical protein|nr:hypothetical protein [Acidobacteriaceae bacterium]